MRKKPLLIGITVGVIVMAAVAVFLPITSIRLSSNLPFITYHTLSDENAVYSTVLEELFAKDGVEFLVISNQTDWMPEARADLNGLDIQFDCVVINREDYDFRILPDEEATGNRKPSISDLIKQHPNSAYIALSAIDFNESRTTASTHVETFGHGRMIFLQKESGHWKIRKITDLWIS